MRSGASFDGVIFGGEAEGVVAEWTEDVETLLGIKTSQYIDDGEVANVTHVKPGAGRVREHFGKEHLGLPCDFGSLKGVGVGPDFLPFSFNFEWFVSIHGSYYSIFWCAIIGV